MKSVWWVGVSVAFALTAAACNNGSDTSTTTPSPPVTSDTLSGTVPAAVNGVPQNSSNPFTVSAAGTVSVTLTSAILTNSDGTTNPNVVVGISVGTWSAPTCTVSANNPPSALQAGAAATISGTLAAGSYCVQVSDVTVQKGPVTYALLVVHP
jgi:hypothetical protein